MAAKRAWWGFGPTYFRVTTQRAAALLSRASSALFTLTDVDPCLFIENVQDLSASGISKTQKANTTLRVFGDLPGNYFEEGHSLEYQRVPDTSAPIGETMEAKDVHNFALGILYALDWYLLWRTERERNDVNAPSPQPEPSEHPMSDRAVQFLRELLAAIEREGK